MHVDFKCYRVDLVRGGIAGQATDVIVNAANASLAGGVSMGQFTVVAGR